MGVLRRESVGKSFGEVKYEVTEQKIFEYAKSYGDQRPLYGEGAPLMFAVVYSFEAGVQPLFEPALSDDPAKVVRRLVRGSLDVEVFHRVKPGDVIQTQAQIHSIEEKGSGELLRIDTISRNAQGAQVAIVRNIHFIRGEAKTKPEKTDVSKPQEARAFASEWESTFQVPAELPLHYADASLDRNPLHTDPGFARTVGFPNVIVQGSATMAIAGMGIVDHVCKGDPFALRRLGCRFVKPVFPGDKLTTLGTGGGTFETRNQDGVPVLEQGVFELGSVP